MTNALFRGSGTALVTPFSDQGVNERVLQELIEFQVSGGTDALVVCGSTGEASTMSPAEQAEVIRISVDAAAGRVPVIAGAGGSDTAVVSALALAAKEQGVDAILVSPPPYNKPTQKGILAHYRAILAAADLPLIVYNVPGRTSCNVLPETIEELAQDPRVVGVKEASGDISQVGDLARRIGDRVAIYSGNDDQVLPLMALGGAGVISVLANIAPGDVSRMVHQFLSGNFEEARKLQLDYLPLIQALFREPNPIPVKAAVKALGFDVGPVRLPLTPASNEVMDTVLKQMRLMGISMGVAV